MDEIEAALDEPNVIRVAHYMRRICDKTQFIVITHRRGTMEAADVLYGVTMQERGVSKVLTINMNDMAKELNIKGKTMGIFARIKKAWYDSIIWETIDEDFYDELEESLIMADLGASVAADAVKELRKVVYEKEHSARRRRQAGLRDILEKKLEVGDTSLDLPQRRASCSSSA